MKYELYVDYNAHYDEDERYKAGEFDSLEEAISEAKKIVDEFLLSVHKKHPNIEGEELFNKYKMVGVDPWILPNYSDYSSWDYAEKRAREICTIFETQYRSTLDSLESQKEKTAIATEIEEDSQIA